MMYPSLSFILFFLIGSLLASLIFHIFSAASRPSNQEQNGRKLPPGPPPLPIIGNLHILGNLPHQTLHRLAKRYGDIMSIRLGNVPTIVVSSPKAAELFLKTHDTVFASRPNVQSAMYLSYGNKGMAFREYGPYWRDVRKLCTLQLLNSSKIEHFAPMRREEVGLLVDLLRKAAAALESVDFSARVGDLIRNMTFRMLFGQSNDEEADIKPLVKEVVQLAGIINVSDYVPFLAPFDIQGLARRMKAVSSTVDKFFEKIIDKHEQDAACCQKKQQRDFIDILLTLMNQPSNSHDETAGVITRTNMKAILLDMIVGSFDTSATMIEWTFSELLRNPRVMKCVQEELTSVVGMNRMVEEIDLSKLTYLGMVIKESARLHPVAPFLVPRESMEDITINGYYIPRKSRVMVNTWAIGRDTNIWSYNVQEFFPERFKDTNIDLRGHDFQLIPFGSGRRGCPGMQLGITVVRLVLAQLLHCFNWDLPDGMLPGELDMNEMFGLSLQRASHLVLVPSYRLLVESS